MTNKKHPMRSQARQTAEKYSRQRRKKVEYKQKYCDMVVEHMAQGFSFNSFAGLIGTSAQTLKRWRELIYEFDEAAQAGEAKSLYFWEKEVVDQARGRNQDGNHKLVELVMKCRFLWTDKQHIELTGSLETQLRQLTDQQLENELRKISARQKDALVTPAEANRDYEIDAAIEKLKR